MANAERDAIYARVSTDRQEKEETIQTQLFRIHETFDPDGREVAGGYLDEDVPGWTMKRPAFDRLVSDAVAGTFDRVLIYDPDRLWRGKPGGRDALESILKAAGCTVRYVYGQQPDTDEGELAAGMQDLLSYFGKKRLVRGMADGRARKLARGAAWRGARPYGWRYVKATGSKRDGHMEHDPEEAPVVRRIFDWILAGKSSYGVAGILNAEGYRTTKGRPFLPTTVRGIVQNPIHTGSTPTNRYEAIKPKKPRNEYNAEQRTSNRKRPASDWKWVDVGAPIVSPEEWEHANKRLSDNRKLSSRNAKHEYLLRGKLRCGCERETAPGECCGMVLTGRMERGVRRVYRCNRTPASDRTVTHCCKGFALADDVEKRVWSEIESAMADPDEILRRTGKIAESEQTWRERLADQITEAQQKRKRAQARLNGLVDLLQTGDLDRATYNEKRAEHLNARDAAEGQIAHLEREIANVGQRSTRLDSFREYCRAFNEHHAIKARGMVFMDHVAMRHVVEDMIDAVWVYPDGSLELDGRLPEKWIPPEGSIVVSIPRDSIHNRAERFTLVIAA